MTVTPWGDVDTHSHNWDERTFLLAKACKGPKVLELGAGRAVARFYFQREPGFSYTATDVTLNENIDQVIDLNEKNFFNLGNQHFDSAMLSGVLEYVDDLPSTFTFLFGYADELVFSYVPASHDLSVAELKYRIEQGWHSHYSVRTLIDLFAYRGQVVDYLGLWHKQHLLLKVSLGARK